MEQKSASEKYTTQKSLGSSRDHSTSTLHEAPRARLVDREHAGNGLLRSIMQKSKDDGENEKKDETKRPPISFGGIENRIKILENRPVQVIPNEPRNSRFYQGNTPRKPLDRQRGPGTFSTPRHPDGSRIVSPDDKKPKETQTPMFQRTIGFSTPSRDGTAKKTKPGTPQKDYTKDGGKRGLKNISKVDDGSFRRGHKTEKKKEKSIEDIKQILVDRTGQEVSISDCISVKEFSDKIGVAIPKVMGEMMKNGMLVSLNAQIDYDTCFLIGEAFGITITKEISEKTSISDLMDGNITEFIREDDQGQLVTRSPIISVMGHVDHGKTSILDYIRKTSVASGEAGGITQKIGAYQVEKNGKKITFLDTPGHEAFTIMRARGAKLTDIAIIVVAADEGMKPQTIESINHAKEAGVGVIVAINKMDKPGANIDLIK